MALGRAEFFNTMEAAGLALTYDDVRELTCSGSEAPLPEVIDVESSFSQNVHLKVPFVSSAMDTVTDDDMATAMAKLGGLGVIHAAMPIDDQRRAVRRVKMAINGFIDRPVTVSDSDTLEEVLRMCDEKRYEFRTFPVVDGAGNFVGMLGGDNFKYPESLSEEVSRAMTPESRVTSGKVGTTLEEAYKCMQERKINTLPLLDEGGTVNGLYLFSDVSRIRRDSVQYNVDANGQLMTAAAVSTGKDTLERVEALRKYLDVAVIDTADGDSYYAFQMLKEIKTAFPGLDVVVGNISNGDSARELAQAGADGIKVGQGPGSICTTRRETGIGMPQVTAIYDAVRSLGTDYSHIPVCADGGIRYHGDISIAIAAGAHSVMMGRVLAGTLEAPGEVISRKNGSLWKVYRGMGSAEALQANAASRERYGANTKGLILPEGIEAQVPYEGSVHDVLGLCLLALRKSMRYVKSPDLTHHRTQTRFVRITNAGLMESHPHDVEAVKQ